MRLLHCSDFHGHEPWYRWLAQACPRYDLVCLTGDLIDLFARADHAEKIRRVSNHLLKLPVPVALCSGNHDDPDLLGAANWIKQLARDRLWKDGDRFSLHGHVFRCIGWGQPMPMVADPAEIWLVHAPPDDCATSQACHGINLGDFELGELCRAGLGPRLALSGHIHEAVGWQAWVGRTWSFNPGYGLDPSRPHAIEIDLDRQLAFRLRPSATGWDLSDPLRL